MKRKENEVGLLAWFIIIMSVFVAIFIWLVQNNIIKTILPMTPLDYKIFHASWGLVFCSFFLGIYILFKNIYNPNKSVFSPHPVVVISFLLSMIGLLGFLSLLVFFK